MNKIIAEDAGAIANAPLPWEKLQGKTVLISGANGYVPQFFVHGLLKRNDLYGSNIKVLALCRNRERALARFEEYVGRADFGLLLQDVCEAVTYGGKIDYMIHAASPAGIKTRYRDPVATFDANVIGCKKLLELAEVKRSEFLLLSSVDVYGKMNSQERLKETDMGMLDTLEPRDIYSNAKRAAETLCGAYFQKGISCKIVRPFQIIGAGLELDDGRLHIDFAAQMLRGNEIVLKGDGTPRRTFLYVTDAVIGMLLVMLEGKAGEIYNVCAKEGEASVLELAETMASQMKGRKISISYDMETRFHDPAVTQVVSVVCGDSGKLRGLGWTPKVTLARAVRRMMAYYGLAEEGGYERL